MCGKDPPRISSSIGPEVEFERSQQAATPPQVGVYSSHSKPALEIDSNTQRQLSVLPSYSQTNYDLQCFPPSKHAFALALTVGTFQPSPLDGLITLVGSGRPWPVPIGSSRWRGGAELVCLPLFKVR